LKITDARTPVVVLRCEIGAITLMRSLGRFGISVYGVDNDPTATAFRSKYCSKRLHQFKMKDSKEFLNYILELGKSLGRKALLVQTSDDLAIFIANNAKALERYFLFPKNDPQLIANIISKEGMYQIALDNDIPTPVTLFPKSELDVVDYCQTGKFPVMLKGIDGNRLEARTGIKMLIIDNKDELIEKYRLLEDPTDRNLMLQEYIPGDDSQVYIFNGYFDANSECHSAFTGHKLRQNPIHIGSASLGICKWNQEVADLTIKFMKDIGYSGILDIGYRFDARDGKYKVLDINPRVGQAFRIFVAENGMDVVRSQYMDLTGQQSDEPIVPREGRRWMIEDDDIVSSIHYYQEGSLTFTQWFRSFKRVEEGAWFSWRDPWPFIVVLGRLTKKSLFWVLKKMAIVKSK
jgi:D-aspartate ligase